MGSRFYHFMLDHILLPILKARQAVSLTEAVLVGISGIDASGKGFVTEKLTGLLLDKGVRTAVASVDGWLNLPRVRFDPIDPAGNFYRNALRLDEMFNEFVIPLKKNGSISLTTDFTEETATEYRNHVYNFRNIDVILLEGIFLFKRGFTEHFDLRVWIDCPFEIALERAVARSQEGLSAAETTRVYRTIYFPAQFIHFAIDDPIATADIVYPNY